MTIGAGAIGTVSLSYDTLIDGMALYGDKINEIACFVMRSKDYFGLMKGNIVAATIDSIAGATLNSGSVATLGKPVLVTDSPALVGLGLDVDDSGVVLALTTNAITCIADDDFYVTTEQSLGKANITIMWQGESQYGVDLAGYAFDKSVSPINRAELGTGANWTKVATDLKNTAGGVLLTLK
jgi:hypothetical protein